MPIVDRVVRRTVRPTLRRSLLDTSSLSAFENGIHLDFTTNTFYTKVAGQDPVVFPTIESMFTFTRGAPDATYLGADGLLKTATTNVPRIEYGTTRTGTNLLLQSADFATTWTVANSSISTNVTADPEGVLIADKLVENSSTAIHRVLQDITITANASYTVSLFVKASERSRVRIILSSTDQIQFALGVFNLSTGVVSSSTAGGTGTLSGATITPYANDWYRVTVSGAIGNSLTTLRVFIDLVDSAGNPSYAGDGSSGLFLTGAQVNPGLSAGVYTPTTTATAYSTSSGNCLGLLMETSKQNVALNNIDLSAGTWTKSACTISSSTSIDGTSRNIRIVENSANAIHGVIAGVTITANTTYCLSAIVSPQGRQFAFLYGINTDQFGAVFDFVNLTSAQIIAGTSTIDQRGIIPFGNGKFLIWVSGILNAASTTLNFVGGPATSLSVPSGYSYLGDGASGINMEYIQIELGSFPTSRIPTAGSAVIRAADSCIRTLGSEFSATAGTVVVQGRTGGGVDAAVAQSVWAICDGSTNNRYNLVRVAAATSFDHRVVTGGVLQNTGTDVVISNLQQFKSAMAWAANDLAASFNGAAVLTDGSMTLPTVTQVELGTVAGASTGNCHIRRFDYYPKRESNDFLQRAST